MKYAVTYIEDVITENKSVEVDDYTSIEFENIGSVNARINNAPLTAGSFPRKYENQPGCVIRNQFEISFLGDGQDKKILIRKTYYNEF